MTTHIKVTAVYREPVDLDRLIAALIQLAAERAAQEKSDKPSGRAA